MRRDKKRDGEKNKEEKYKGGKSIGVKQNRNKWM